MVLGDTATCPNDGTTAGSGTTPRTVPAVRQAAAAVRQLLVERAAEQWQVEPNTVEARDGKVVHTESNRTLTLVDVAKDKELADRLSKPPSGNVRVTPVAEWTAMGKGHAAPAARDKVTGRHRY